MEKPSARRKGRIGDGEKLLFLVEKRIKSRRKGEQLRG